MARNCYFTRKLKLINDKRWARRVPIFSSIHESDTFIKETCLDLLFKIIMIYPFMNLTVVSKLKKKYSVFNSNLKYLLDFYFIFWKCIKYIIFLFLFLP